MANVRLNKLNKHQRLVAIVIMLAASGMFALALVIIQQYTTVIEPEKELKLPDYQTIIPVNKTIEKLSERRSIKSPEGDTIFSFTDAIDNVRIDISEQLLPDSYKSDINAKVKMIAEGFYANDKITLDDTTAYMGTSSKGPQWVILSRNNLLIIIKSEKNIKISSWQNYIKNLNSISNANVPKF